MILDILDNAPRYLTLAKGFAKAFEFLFRPDLKDLPVGRYEIDGERIYAMVVKDHGRSPEDALLEAHEQYIDIQLVLAGTDAMGWKPKSLCQLATDEYDEKTDVQFFTDPPTVWLPTEPGAFAIFFPEDAHMPMISPEQLHKVIIKVAVTTQDE